MNTKTPIENPLSWIDIIRLGLVQTALGGIVVLTTSTLNRVMVVELALPAILPGALVGWHYAVQMSRPRWGYGADVGGARTPWIIGGMAALAIGAVSAAGSTALMAASPIAGVIAAALSFTLIGAGVGASGTNLLAMLAARTAPSRKAAAAAIVWIMMIFGFVVTAGVAGHLLDPFSMERLIRVAAGVCTVAFFISMLAISGIERGARAPQVGQSLAGGASAAQKKQDFREALSEIWREPQARRFTIFIFASMLAYSAQDLILEPFAGIVYGLTPGESTKLSGTQNGGVLIGMIATAVVGTVIGKSRASFMRRWTVGGCFASAIALAALATGALVGPSWPLNASVFALGLANGAFAVAAIGSMMTLASAGEKQREGTRMGLWGAAQAVAFGLGGFLGAAAIDATRAVFGDPSLAFSFVFATEGAMFIVAAILAMRVGATSADNLQLPAMPAGEHLPAQ
ncbi:MAG: BCD family MFS transporter [Pseudomonadota bacterium]